MTQQRRFDPASPLPGAPTPWAASSMPPIRPGPPFLMTDMIESEPSLARRLLSRLGRDAGLHALADAVRTAAGEGEPIVLVGCGTSEHGARAAADILCEALAGGGSGCRPVARQAFEAALDPPMRGLLIAISHEGATWATNRALEAAKAAGARTALVTVSDRSPGAALADIVVATAELDQSWCHTVGYVSPILAATALASVLSGTPVPHEIAGALLDDGLDQAGAAEEAAGILGPLARLLVVASGADRPAAAELALKIEEGAWLPATALDLETLLHGHLAAADASTGVVFILAERDSRRDRLARARSALDAVGAIGMLAAGIFSEAAASDLETSLTPAGRLSVREAPELPPAVAALLGTVVPLQLLAERLARARGTNPDPIRREDPRHAEAAARAELTT